jgi:DNA-binding response OmpR family regulator
MWQVLLAEDDVKDRQKLIDGLKDLGVCTIAEDGSQALQIFQDWQKDGRAFDFILLDVTMPEQSGFDVLKIIRSQEDTHPQKGSKEPFIIMITSYKDSLMDRYNMGWDHFITKPVDLKILVERMRSITALPKHPK